MNDYAHPETLVETDWLAEHLNDPSHRIVESNEDILLYDTGHIAGAVHIDWRRDLQDQVQRHYINPAQFAQLAGLNAIGKDTTVVFYGDKANWWAALFLPSLWTPERQASQWWTDEMHRRGTAVDSGGSTLH